MEEKVELSGVGREKVPRKYDPHPMGPLEIWGQKMKDELLPQEAE